MINKVAISVIIPCYNAELYIKDCLKSLLGQNIKNFFEIIVIDDASKDKTVEIIKKFKLSKIKFFSLKKNSGPAAARNLGLQKAKGEYVFYLDVDDKISKKILKELYNLAIQKNFDMVFCDKKLIENYKNQRENQFYYPQNKIFSKLQITNELLERFTNPSDYSGIFLHYGKLIKRSLLIKNKILFVEKLRYLEDEIFGWDTLGNTNSVAYLKKQLYSYYVHPKISTARSDAFNKGFPISNFFIIKDHIKKSLMGRDLKNEICEKYSNHAFTYFIVNSLVSYSMSLMFKKIKNSNGNKIFENFIKKLITNEKIMYSFRQYKPSKQESKWIPKAILTKSILLTKLACKLRCKQIVKKQKER
jgi:glycosyltransferase involved in cell wall biosynthesis